jgi:MFS transporter, ACS family, tartrate transporter
METQIEKDVVRKLYWRIVYFCCLLFFFNYIDRVNIGFAALKMNEDLKFSAAAYGFGAGIFFISYALLEVPSNLILNRVGPRLWLARIMVTWGIISSCFAFVQTEMQFYVLRFLLGAAEAGFVPGIVLYFTYWFPNAHRGKAFAAFFSAAQVSSIIGAPLSGWLIQSMAGVHGFSGWQWMFIIEGLPSVALGVAILFVLSDRPQQARWLSEPEKTWLVDTIEAERRANPAVAHGSIGQFLRDRRVLALAAIYFFYAVSVYGVLFWLPLIIKGFGDLTPLQIGFLTSLPYICAFAAVLLVARHSDRTGERKYHVAFSALLGGVALIGSALAGSPVLAFILLCVAAIGIWGQNGVFWTLPTSYLVGASAAGGIAFINSVAQFGGFLGPYMVGWVRDTTGSFSGALMVLACASFMVTVIAASLRIEPQGKADANLPSGVMPKRV